MNTIEVDSYIKSKTDNNSEAIRPFLPQKVFTYTDEEIRHESENMQKLRELRQKYLPTTIKMKEEKPKFIQSQKLENSNNLNSEENKPEILLLKSKNTSNNNNVMSNEYEILKNEYDKLLTKYEDLKSEINNDKSNTNNIFNNYENVIKILVNHINKTSNDSNLLNCEQIISLGKDNDNAKNLINDLEKKLDKKNNYDNSLRKNGNKNNKIKKETKKGKKCYYDNPVKRMAKNEDILEVMDNVNKISYWSGNEYITES